MEWINFVPKMRAAALFLALCVSAASALYSSSSKVVQLSEKDFKQVLKGDELWLVEFYAPYVHRVRSAVLCAQVSSVFPQMVWSL